MLPKIGSDLPQVVLVDIELPGKSGIEGIRLLKERYRALVLVVLTVFDDDRRIFEAICAGASGYLLKKTPAPTLVQSIRDAAAGGSPMSPEIAARVIALYRQTRPSAVTHDLTPHEVRVLKLLVEGHNYKTAAVELGVSVNTISFHMRHIYEKLHVHTKSEAVAKALRNQIVG
jgi:DNA-binding NarL/FixJ family response regulator